MSFQVMDRPPTSEDAPAVLPLEQQAEYLGLLSLTLEAREVGIDTSAVGDALFLQEGVVPKVVAVQHQQPQEVIRIGKEQDFVFGEIGRHALAS